MHGALLHSPSLTRRAALPLRRAGARVQRCQVSLLEVVKPASGFRCLRASFELGNRAAAAREGASLQGAHAVQPARVRAARARARRAARRASILASLAVAGQIWISKESTRRTRTGRSLTLCIESASEWTLRRGRNFHKKERGVLRHLRRRTNLSHSEAPHFSTAGRRVERSFPRTINLCHVSAKMSLKSCSSLAKRSVQ